MSEAFSRVRSRNSWIMTKGEGGREGMGDGGKGVGERGEGGKRRGERIGKGCLSR